MLPKYLDVIALMIYTTLWTRVCYKSKGGFDFQNSPVPYFWICTFQSLKNVVTREISDSVLAPASMQSFSVFQKGRFLLGSLTGAAAGMWSHTVAAGAAVKDRFPSQPIDCGVCSSTFSTGVKIMDGFVIKLLWFLKAVRFQSGHICLLCDVHHRCNHFYPQKNGWACSSNEDVIFSLLYPWHFHQSPQRILCLPFSDFELLPGCHLKACVILTLPW